MNVIIIYKLIEVSELVDVVFIRYNESVLKH